MVKILLTVLNIYSSWIIAISLTLCIHCSVYIYHIQYDKLIKYMLISSFLYAVRTEQNVIIIFLFSFWIKVIKKFSKIWSYYYLQFYICFYIYSSENLFTINNFIINERCILGGVESVRILCYMYSHLHLRHPG